MGPIYQNGHPLSRECLRVCQAVQRLEMPLLIHQGTTFPLSGPLAYARPFILDEIALHYPELRFVIAHVGHPSFEEAISVVRRHPHVFADVSALVTRRWQLYQIVVSAAEYRVAYKLLFGTDYPLASARATIDGLRKLVGNPFGTGMPVIVEEVIEGIIQRDSLELLGPPVP